MSPRGWLSLALWLALALIGLSAPKDRFDRKELTEDAREIVRILEATHPDPYSFGGGKIAFHRRFRNLLDAIPPGGMEVNDFCKLLLPFLAQVGDGHTYLIPPNWSKENDRALPLQMMVVDRRILVTGVRSPHLKFLLNSTLGGIEGVPFPELVEREKKILAYENEYHNLDRLTRRLQKIEQLKLLLPEWKDYGSVRATFEPVKGKPFEHEFSLPQSGDGELITNESRLQLPSTQRSDIAYGFVGGGRKTVLLRIDDMQTYRECHEHWRFYGNRYEELARQTYQRYHQREAPSDLNQVIDALPSATECFRNMVVDMKQAGAKNLIIDLRMCPGGVSNVTEILMYFLFGKEKTVDVLAESYQIRKYSEVYYEYAAGEKFDPGPTRRPSELLVNDYDFLEEAMYFQKSDREGKRRAIRRELDEMTGHMPTFLQEYAGGRYEAYYAPERIFVLSEAGTFSSAFWMLQCFCKGGAKLVGIPSGQAPNAFSDQNPYLLKNTGLTLYTTCKYSVAFPELPPGRNFLKPDYVLTYDRLKAYRFDPNAAVLLALEEGQQREK